jgi:hypothetical protein
MQSLGGMYPIFAIDRGLDAIACLNQDAAENRSLCRGIVYDQHRRVCHWCSRWLCTTLQPLEEISHKLILLP